MSVRWFTYEPKNQQNMTKILYTSNEFPEKNKRVWIENDTSGQFSMMTNAEFDNLRLVITKANIGIVFDEAE